MDDFTKEELICIRDNLIVPDTAEDKNILLSAYHKLLAAIDSYCEHEFVATVGRPLSTPGWHEAVIKCAHCGITK